MKIYFLEQDESDVKDISHYKFPFENLVLEGGGVKGVAYVGLLKVFHIIVNMRSCL